MPGEGLIKIAASVLSADFGRLGEQVAEAAEGGAIALIEEGDAIEIDIPALAEMAVEQKTARPNVERYTVSDGRRLHVLGEGRLINLAAAEGHPASVMDMSFAGQALSTEHMYKNADNLEAKVYEPPKDIDPHIDFLILESL